jgi:N-methylhydantoinase A
MRICVDVGGTFTDLASVDEQGNIRIAKSPTTPTDYTQGVENCLSILAEEVGQPVNKVLEQCSHFAHGSTIAINAALEGKVAKVGFLTTQGFRDILTLREGGKDDPFNTHEHYSKPYVPRYLTLPVRERINAEGEVESPLDEDGARQAMQTLIERYHVDAVAVCFLWSVVNPVHEKRVKEIMAENWPKITCVLSSETNPIIREYRRASSTVIEASVRPIVKQYINAFAAKLKEKGYQGTLYIVTSSGSILAAEEAAQKGLSMMGSGPAMAPTAAKWCSAIEGDTVGNVISLDMGGTSLDISMMTNGEIAKTREAKIANDQLGINVIDARSIGAGGGSIAWIDPGGLIHVGPESAGAVPGPACYDHGGEKPTVTDANLILGYINPAYFLGGRMKVEPRLAEQAVVENIAIPLNLDVNEAAFTIWSTINVNMVSAIQNMTMWQGIDPREYMLVVGGGAGGCHAVALAKELQMKKVLIPRYGGVYSAMGGLVADVSADFSRSFFTTTDSFDHDGVNELLEDLENQARAFLSRLGASSHTTEIEFYVEARYPYQVWELPIRLRGNRIRNEQDISALTNDFHAAHERVFTIKESGKSIECVNWLSQAIAKMPEVKQKEAQYASEDPSAALTDIRQAYFRDLGGMAKTQIYRGSKLARGNVIRGPAVIEEPVTTIVIPPGSVTTVTKWGNYLIELQA